MKPTKSLLNFIDTWTTKYCEYLKINKPHYFFKAIEARRWNEETYPKRRWYRNMYKYYGVAWKDDDAVFLNLKISPSRKRLKQTIAHELLHLKYETSHSPWFRNKLKQLLKVS